MVVLGIDLGTSNSVVARATSVHNAEVINSPVGSVLTPSYVTVGPTDVVCGEVAKQRQATHPKITFFEFKRTIGRSYLEKSMWDMATDWPFSLTKPKNLNNPPLYSAMLNGTFEQLTAHDLYIHLLRYMLRDVPRDVDCAVATVPATFKSVQRDATRAAVERVLPNTRVVILNEPTAAALAYLQQATLAPNDEMLVLDVGGGTADATLLTKRSDGTIDVLGTNGSSNLGGAMMTEKMLKEALIHYAASNSGVRVDKVLLRDAVEQAKKTLSATDRAEVAYPEHPDSPYVMTRNTLESKVQSEIMEICELAAVTGGDRPQLKHIVLCGGTTRMPVLRNTLGHMFPDAKMSTDLNPDTAVARGAALHALNEAAAQRRVTGDNGVPRIRDILTSSVALRVYRNKAHVVLRRGTRLPAKSVEVFEPMNRTKQTSMDLVFLEGESDVVVAKYNIQGSRDIRVTVAAGTNGEVVTQVVDDLTGEHLLSECVRTRK